MTSLICSACGSPTAVIDSMEEEHRALEEFHALLRGREPGELVSLLQSGFLPDHRPILIEAGVNTLPFLANWRLEEAAKIRIDTIIAKLELMPPDPDTRRAIETFQAKLVDLKPRQRSDYRVLLGFLAVAALVVVALVFLL